ncbi:uncharacterized protein LOC133298866 isoform X2 [Gastrolobium bilobum]|uniref:uncharacterized protein LOC133298866 isoform X2 n=1 Tax=Gastrolobium bilobum TaxID=150636 RepID=UPI002AB301F5|nr:uncharacterized protein LOC133298866 isoform X2 [Gastrolobium bilobum]
MEFQKHDELELERKSTWLELKMELPLGIPTQQFLLEKAVCSHGLFMMAPNHWDPLSNTLTRPLRLHHHHHDHPSSSLIVSISQHHAASLAVRVHGTHSLSPQQESALLVSRMLHLSEEEEKTVREFRSMPHLDHQNRSFTGRVFRSSTLFEDMVKCMLLCNCQWSRTLSMAQALCELQLELQNESPRAVSVSGNPKVETEDFIPKTPAAKVTGRKGRNSSGVSTKGTFCKKKLELEVAGNASSSNVTLLPTDVEGNACHCGKSCVATEEPSSDDSFLQLPNGREYFNHTGNFPSPSELANLDESFLAKRCNLGYRASRIIKLAQAIVEGKIQLRQLEELSKDASLSNYKLLEDQLKQITGFGPFTRANVLMCMGYYHVIPTDSETIRHLKQVHSRNSSSKTIDRDVEEIYGKYEPYQFLAYWSEMLEFYERRFGKMNEMHSSDYKLITGSNMRSASKGTSKRKRLS